MTGEPRQEGIAACFVLQAGHLPVDRDDLTGLERVRVQGLERTESEDLAAESQLGDFELRSILGREGRCRHSPIGPRRVSACARWTCLPSPRPLRLSTDRAAGCPPARDRSSSFGGVPSSALTAGAGRFDSGAKRPAGAGVRKMGNWAGSAGDSTGSAGAGFGVGATLAAGVGPRVSPPTGPGSVEPGIPGWLGRQFGWVVRVQGFRVLSGHGLDALDLGVEQGR